jgi:hypothetical protein
VQVPTVAFSVMLYGPSLHSSELSNQSLTAMRLAVANAAGAAVSTVSIAGVDWALQAVFSLSDTPNSMPADAVGTALEAALYSAAGAHAGNTTLEVLGTNTVTTRRRLQSSPIMEVTVLAASSSLTTVQYFNATLQSALSNGSLSAALQASGVIGGAVALAVAHQTGLQFHFVIACASDVDLEEGSALPSATTLFAAVSQGTLAAQPAFLADVNAAGLGSTITSLTVSRQPIIGALAVREGLFFVSRTPRLLTARKPRAPLRCSQCGRLHHHRSVSIRRH